MDVLSSFEKLRRNILNQEVINMLHLGPRAFAEISGEVVNTTSFVLAHRHNGNYKAVYLRLVDYKSEEEKRLGFLEGSDIYSIN